MSEKERADEFHLLSLFKNWLMKLYQPCPPQRSETTIYLYLKPILNILVEYLLMDGGTNLLIAHL